MSYTESEYYPYDFANRRHIGPSPAEIAAMLEAVGAPSLDALIDETLPLGIRQAEPLDWGPALSEQAALHRLRRTAAKNKVLTSLIGQGYHGARSPRRSSSATSSITPPGTITSTPLTSPRSARAG